MVVGVLLDGLVDRRRESVQVENEVGVDDTAHLLSGQFEVVRLDARLSQVLDDPIGGCEPLGDVGQWVEGGQYGRAAARGRRVVLAATGYHEGQDDGNAGRGDVKTANRHES